MVMSPKGEGGTGDRLPGRRVKEVKNQDGIAMVLHRGHRLHPGKMRGNAIPRNERTVRTDKRKY
jgi:hypothetical protein